MNRLSADSHITLLVKGAERYVLLYDRATCADALRQLGRWASNPELGFNWHDAAVMSCAVRDCARGY